MLYRKCYQRMLVPPPGSVLTFNVGPFLFPMPSMCWPSVGLAQYKKGFYMTLAESGDIRSNGEMNAAIRIRQRPTVGGPPVRQHTLTNERRIAPAPTHSKSIWFCNLYVYVEKSAASQQLLCSSIMFYITKQYFSLKGIKKEYFRHRCSHQGNAGATWCN